MLLIRRFTLIFYRVSTYQRLVKVLLVAGYAMGLSVFFGLFIASDKDRREPVEASYAALDNIRDSGNNDNDTAAPKAGEQLKSAPEKKNKASPPTSKAERYNHAVDRVKKKLEKHLGPEKTETVAKIASRAIDDLEHSRIVTPDQAKKMRLPLE